jgi:hypothetical protein
MYKLLVPGAWWRLVLVVCVRSLLCTKIKTCVLYWWGRWAKRQYCAGAKAAGASLSSISQTFVCKLHNFRF